MMTRRYRLALLVTTIVLGAARSADPPANVQFTPDIVYGKVGDDELKLNLAVPKTAGGPWPCVVIFHGGAWRHGDRSMHNDLAWNFAQRGFASATIGYRLVPKHVFPAQVQDVKCAVRFLRTNSAKYNIDPDRIGAVGFSAGAHLSMMLGAMDSGDGLDDSGGSPGVSSKVQAVVAHFGPTDFTLTMPDSTRPLIEDFLGGPLDRRRDVYLRASPVTYLDKGDAPLLVLHGTADNVCPPDHATRISEAMQKAGVPGRVELISGAGHGWDGAHLRHAIGTTFSFFDRHLKPSTANGK